MRAPPILACWSVAPMLLLSPGSSWAADHKHGLTIEREPPDGGGFFWSHQVGLRNGETAYFRLSGSGRTEAGVK